MIFQGLSLIISEGVLIMLKGISITLKGLLTTLQASIPHSSFTSVPTTCYAISTSTNLTNISFIGISN